MNERSTMEDTGQRSNKNPKEEEEKKVPTENQRGKLKCRMCGGRK